MKTNQKHCQRSRPLFEELEPRILFSADAAAGLFGAAHWAPDAEVRLLDQATSDVALQQSHEIAFVDTGVEGYQLLLGDLQEQKDAGRSIDIYLIDSTQDGVQEIGRVLSNHHDLDAVHIFSHGANGALMLGKAILDSGYVEGNESMIAQWGEALSGNGDLLLYGCDLAADAGGQALIEQLGRLTRADVAASADLTGAASKGGNWILEYQTGSIEAALVIDAVGQARWQGVLLNSAPVLDDGKNPALASINEDIGAPFGVAGTLVSALVDPTLPAGQLDNVNDPDPGALLGIAVTAANNANGTWYYSTNNGGAWLALGAVSDASARLLAADANTRLYFQPNSNFSGMIAGAITFRAWDQTSGSNGTLDNASVNGAATAFSESTDTASIYVNPTNDAPALASGTLASIAEDVANPPGQTLAAIYAGKFTDVDAGSSLGGVAVISNATNAVTEGVWQYSTNAGGNWFAIGSVGDGNTALALDAATLVRFVPSANYSGTPPALLLRALDNTYAGGYSSTAGAEIRVAVDTTTRGGTTAIAAASSALSTMVTPVNDAPLGTSGSVTTLEDAAYTFNVSDFGFTDPVDTPADSLLAVRITTLPGAGTLANNGTAVTAGQFVSAADIAAGRLVFTPVANASGAAYAAFTFQVQDNGGTASGGTDLDSAPKTLTVDVTPVNDMPLGASKTVTTLEDTAYTFNVSDFGFTDPVDTPADSLLAVRITTLPGAGALANNGTAVTAGQFVSAADIAAGRLVFTPVANTSGAAYAVFTFQVQDNGGTAFGGTDLDSAPKTLTVDVTSSNVAPAMLTATLTLTGGETISLSTANINAADVDSPTSSFVYTVSSLQNGYFALATAPTVPVVTFTHNDLNANLVRFVHPANTLLAPTFMVSVSDGDLASAPLAAQINFSPDLGAYIVLLSEASEVQDVPSAQQTELDGDPDQPSTTAAALPQEERFTQIAPQANRQDDQAGELLTGQAVFLPAQPLQQQSAAFASALPINPESSSNAAELDIWLEHEKIDNTFRLISMNSTFQGTERQLGQPVFGEAIPVEEEGDNTIVNQIKAHAVQVAGVSVTSGVAWWALRASGLLAGLLTSLPTWRQVDPLLLVGDKSGKDDLEEETEEEDLETAESEQRVEGIFGKLEKSERA